MAKPVTERVMADDRYIVWLDIDNTLYTRSSRIAELMIERIHAYFLSMGFTDDDAHELHSKYYTQYGLALRGLMKHHNIDALDFDKKCDGSLPLEDILKPDPKVRKLIEDIDRSKARVWALTNAYSTHANRVLRVLNLSDLIEEIFYCDYSSPDFSCKPEPSFYAQALSTAGVTDPSKCLFVDDNLNNVRAAKSCGWGHCVLYSEREEDHSMSEHPKVEGVDAVIGNLQELRELWKQVFQVVP
ncbi:pyrimidine 5-nucleotidase [Dacryopinax primogenitus]|uniref:Pyrimidine 5-nucleotidase n=1 Tax=Dacryopinax primogenitus (strain DJM 731) TaxID=1858805 RepID=M5GC81_DACPD|nr:pyrimidine 5-nucleotidase [Dacryopinax primogenitus]EJU06105.1 pyrimidine 5-nucleotidase [Dacryopinax primogenitus]